MKFLCAALMDFHGLHECMKITKDNANKIHKYGIWTWTINHFFLLDAFFACIIHNLQKNILDYIKTDLLYAGVENEKITNQTLSIL